MEEYLINYAKKIHINLTGTKCKQLIRYYELLIEWNNKMNLTSITEFEEVVVKHFIDSLSIVNCIDLNGNLSLVDVGTGAGFPGIPLKIVFPSLNVTLVDSLDKRIKFLNYVISELELDNIVAVHARAEEFGNSKYRESFDICVTRAVANLAVIAEYCLPLVKLDGSFIAYKGSNVKEEIYDSEIAIEELGGSIDDVSMFQLPDTDIDRSLIRIYKEDYTPKKYPRRNGVPLKKPIK
ncbi:MAG: 16S rRNA (guanine(527)-N(7))-methyltransferase RsmG [Lachnospiraceae bacterium]|nr:16S rRNA (guanine(527)-N(7))-methyltransferase RsmG [Lachnospiraceae bacterium]